MEDTMKTVIRHENPAKKEVELDSALAQLAEATDRLDTVTAQLETRLRRISQPVEEDRPGPDEPMTLRQLYGSEIAQAVAGVTVCIDQIAARVNNATDRLEV